MKTITLNFHSDKPDQVFENALGRRYSGNYLIITYEDSDKTKDDIFWLNIIKEVIISEK